VERDGSSLAFDIHDRDDPSASVPVEYSGTVPDPFREGREVIVTGELRDGTFVAEKDSLVTKCPSKFAEEAEENPDQVIIE
jgi:cytochrome c-type biogenesis protein CcmE